MSSAPAAPSASLSQQLLTFALSQDPTGGDAALLDWAADRLVDTIGVALTCASYDLGTAATRSMLADPSPGRASVWATGGRTLRPDDAGFANGMVAHGMDYDDTHAGAALHPGIVVVPTAVAVGEQVGASGRAVLEATLVGYEIACRLGLLSSGRLQSRGLHTSSVLGIFGGVAAAARLMGLSHGQAVHAAGIAGSMASGLMEYLSDGSETKQVHPGWAVRGALSAVQLARHGATGPATVLEGPSGIYRALADVEVDPADALADLGTRWESGNVMTKPYAACHCLHAPVDAFLALRRRHRLAADDVAQVTGLVPPWYVQLVCDPLVDKQSPRSHYEARFSLPYSLARAVVDDELTLDSYEEDRLGEAAVLEVAQRIDYEVLDYPEYPTAFPGGVRVTLRDGTVLEEHLRHNLGSAQNPMSAAQLEDKFLAGAGRVGTDAAARRLLASLRGLPTATDLAEVTASLAGLDAGLAAGHPWSG